MGLKCKSKCGGGNDHGHGHSHSHHNQNPPTIQIRKPSTSSASSDGSSNEKVELQKLSRPEVQIANPSSATSTTANLAPTASHLGHQSTVVTKDSPRLFLLYGIIILQLAIFITELITDQLTHSLLILTDAYHHLFIACNAILLVLCFKISNQVSVKNTFGWVRIEVLGMLTTITFIVALIFSLLIEGALQIMHLHEISTPTNFNVLLIFGVWSLIVNVLYVLIINGVVTEKKYKQTTRTERSFSTAQCEPSTSAAICGEALMKEPCEVTTTSVITEPLPRATAGSNASSADTNNNKRRSVLNSELPSEQTIDCFLGSMLQGVLSPLLVLMASVAIILFPDHDFINMADPLIGVITAILLCISFFPQLKNTMLILMQTVPENVNVIRMKKEMREKFPHIQNIHELHVWRLTSANIVSTCHIVLPRQSTKEYLKLFDSIKTFMSNRYGISHVTIQPEFSNWNSTCASEELVPVTENECFMKCPKTAGCEDSGCDELTCCAVGNGDLNRVMVHGHGHSHGHGHAHF